MAPGSRADSAKRRIVIIDGHPDRGPERFLHALAGAYAKGAQDAGHDVQVVNVANLGFPLLRTATDFESGRPPDVIRAAQEVILQADHLLILYPLWLGSMPALLKGFLEQLLRPSFTFEKRASGMPKKLLAGKSAHVVVTMGMPGTLYKWYYRSHGIKSFERNVLKFVGIAPVRTTVIGLMGNPSTSRQQKWLDKMSSWGTRAK